MEFPKKLMKPILKLLFFLALSPLFHLSLNTSTPPSLSSITSPSPSHSAVLESSITLTLSHVKKARARIAARFKNQDSTAPEKNALRDCIEMQDQTLYQLAQAIREVGLSPSYGSINALLSAAMTNENTCIDGFLELTESGPRAYSERLRSLLGPISRAISGSLALVKRLERERSVGKRKKAMLGEDKYRNYVGRRIRRRRRRAPAAGADVTVASDGSGNCSLIGEAIAMAPNKSGRGYVIRIKAGIYRENVVVPREKMNVVLVGDGMNKTIITGSRNFVDGFSTFESATLTVMGDKFMAKNLTIENTSSPEKHQAVALRVTSNAAFSHCEIKSNQDTLYAHSLRQFYHYCIIQGTIDFIFGNAAAVFQNCVILVREPIPGQRNTITAQGRDDPNQNTGIILDHCTIEAAREFDVTERSKFPTYLGRPWRNYSRTVVVNSYLGDLIHPRGWLEWSEYSSGDTVEYIECMNFGPGAYTRRRVTWAGYRKNCSEDVVNRFKAEEFLHSADGWLESTVFPLFAAS